MPENIYALKIFRSFDRDLVDKIIDNCPVRSYKAKSVILMEGEKSNGEGYILKHGNVSISIGGRHIVDLYPGDIFGELALLNEETRNATVSSISDVEVIVLDIDNFMEMINSDPNNINKEIIRRIEQNLALD